MKADPKSPEEYLQNLEPERKEAMIKLRQAILGNLPAGFEETINYGMLGYVVPHSIYPSGYHCDPKLPLPFINLASQKNYIALYHHGLYAKKELMDWWIGEFPKHSSRKLDMGKSCIRFKKMDQIPFALVGDLVAKMTPKEWIAIYEAEIKR